MPPAHALPASFPPGREIVAYSGFDRKALHEIDLRLRAGECPNGRIELDRRDARLTCLVHDSKPHVAGLLDRNIFSRVPLYDFTLRAQDFGATSCRLVKCDPAMVLMAAVHFCNSPTLRGSVRLVDPAHVLAVLSQESRDAAVSIERAGARTLLFLHHGKPARLYFGEPAEDPGEGTLEDRILLWAFAAGAPDAVVEVFTHLNVEPDPDAGRSLAELEAHAQPPPPTTVVVRVDGRQVRERPFSPPMVIGRDPKVDLFIDNLGVSRRHALLSWERGHYLLRDLESSNGTLVNDELIVETTVTPEDRIRLGKFDICLIEEATEPVAPETMLLASRQKRKALPAYLVADGKSYPVGGELLIGKGDGVDLRARGWRVGDVHARVSRDAGGAYQVSCFGKRTLRLHGRKVASSKLELGDQFQIGRSRFDLRG